MTNAIRLSGAGAHKQTRGDTCSSLASLFAGAAIAVLVTFVSTVSAAEKPFAAPDTAATAPVDTAGSLSQVTLSLLLVLAAVFAAAWLVRRLRGFGRPGAGAIEVIADMPLSAKERAVLIQVGNQQLLLGVAPGRVTTLHVLAEPIKPAAPATPEAAPGTRPDFKAILKRSLGI